MEFGLTDENASPEDLLASVALKFGRDAVFTTAFGLEGSVLLHMIGRAQLPVRVVTLDTGLFFPQTLATKAELEKRVGLTVESVRPEIDLDEQARLHGPELWTREPNQCCNIRKVRPLQSVLEPAKAWITGIRRDQTPERANAPKVGRDDRYDLVKINPIVDWTIEQVRAYLHEHDVPYNPMFDDGYPSIGCMPCTRPVSPGDDPRSGRWAGFDKRECGIHFVTAPDGTVQIRRGPEANP